MSELNVGESVNFFHAYQESSMLAIALDDFTIIIVDIDTHNIVRRFVGHTAQITDTSFSADSRWLISSSMDGSIRTWNVPSGQLIDQFSTNETCMSLCMSPTGEALVTAHVNYLGLLLWSNKSIYSKITLKALSPLESPPLVQITEYSKKIDSEEDKNDGTENIQLTPEQISENLITLSALSPASWLNLMEIETIRKRNKPLQPPQIQKAAPFLLPTLLSLNDIKFDIKTDSQEDSRILKSLSPLNMTDFGKMLKLTSNTNDFSLVMNQLFRFGPSTIYFEIKSLSPYSGGSVEVMLQYFKCIEFILKSNKNFELAEAYMSIFLKAHGSTIAQEKTLRNYLPNIRSCHVVAWHRLQNNLLYIQCILWKFFTSQIFEILSYSFSP